MRCAVLGRPIGHSLSPVLHRAGYAAAGLDWTYDAVDVGNDELADFLGGLGDEWRGLSLTMPLKRTVVPLVDELSDRAVQAQAANTVIFERGRRIGHNTDIPGAAAAIRERYDGPVETATVIGGGATAASVLLALADLGCRRARLVVRSEERASETLAAAARHPHAPDITFDPAGPSDIVVSTIPADAQDDAVVAHARSASCVFEVLYHPWPTPLAAFAIEQRKPLVGGLDLLVHQAALQFTLMTGHEAPLAEMRAAGEAAL
ncbi:MAG TPA: shikimate dehydrogenase [Nocardioidaceae bacterium]|nr:shikimate dehydrogenase [Nocardioidaceae bacterium]